MTDQKQILAAYLTAVPPVRLAASLEVLLDLGVLRQTGPTTYHLQERIKNLTRR